MDAALLQKDFGDVEFVEFALDGPLGVASTGAITPNRTLSGVPLQTLHDDSTPLQWLAFGVDLRLSGPVGVFIWMRGDDAPPRYIEEILALSPEARAAFLVQFFFAHCENTYFAPSWWAGLDDNQRWHVETLMANANPYYHPPRYDLHATSLSPWNTAKAQGE